MLKWLFFIASVALAQNGGPVLIQNNPLPPLGTGANVIGAVTQSGTWNVSAAQSGNWSVRLQDGSGNSLASTANALNVAIQNATLVVTQSGTWTVGQSGTWTVQPGNTANTTAWLVTGTGGTFPITAASLPLPTGASTAAKQPSLGTAGTASTDVLTVQGIASMTPINTTISAGTAVIGHVITDSGSTMVVTSIPSIPAGSAVIGHVITDTGSTTAVTGTVTISGTVTANAGTNLNTSLLALESGGNLAILAGGISGGKYQANVAQVAGGTTATAATGVQKVGIVGNAGAAVDQAPGSAAPANALQIAGTDGTNTRVPYMDPCEFNAWTYYPINVSANAQIVAGSSGKNVYVCKMFISPVPAAANVNLVESATSGNACATSPTGMLGGATAALGANIAINGGYVLPADKRAWAKTATAGDAMCIFVSAQTSGVLAYVQF